MIRTKSIYDPASEDDGIRVLVTRYWPRGVKKEKKDYWFKDLGTDPDLIRLWKAGGITWDEFKERYLDALESEDKKRVLRELNGIIEDAHGGDITLLCTCKDNEPCHRDILKEMLKKSAGAG